MTSHIQELIEQGEHQQLDFKFAITDSRKIGRSLVAFANTDGGRLLIGVKDNGAIAGVRSQEEYYMIEAAAQMYSKPEVQFQSKIWKESGKTVLEIIVPKSETIPHYAQNDEREWKAYIRVKDQNLLANSVLQKVWKNKYKKTGIFVKYTEKEKVLLDFLEKNETITISKFCRIAYLSRKKAENILVSLILLNIIEIVFTEKNVFYRGRKLRG